MTRPRLDLAGQRFGKLTAIKPVDQDKKKNVLWVCQCDCGRLDVVSAARLRSGKKTDCGCVRKELLAKSKAEREAEQKAIKLAKLQLKAEKEAEKEARKKARTEEQLFYEKMDERKKRSLTGSLCWNCIRSAAPSSLQCVWDKSKGRELPDGALTKYNVNRYGLSMIITKCPEFLPIYEFKNAKLLEQERKKARM